MKLKPLNDFILLRMVEKQTKKSALILNVENEYPEFEVISVGPGTSSNPPAVKAGDILLLANKYNAHPVKVEDEMLFMCQFANVLGIKEQ